MLLDYILVSLFGALIGCAELLAQYREHSFRHIILTNPGAWVYIFINLIASASVLFFLRVFGVSFGIEQNPEVLRWVQVLAAGFGAMAIFRSSLFSYQAKDQVVSVGPNMVLQIFLERAGRSVGSSLDRADLVKRATLVAQEMEGVSFNAASQIIPSVGISLKRSLPEEEQEGLFNYVKTLANSSLPESIKVTLLGLNLLDMLGEDALSLAIALSKNVVVEEPAMDGGNPDIDPASVSKMLSRIIAEKSEEGEDGDFDLSQIADLIDSQKELDEESSQGGDEDNPDEERS